MKYLTDKEIEALSDEEKFNRLELLDFQRVFLRLVSLLGLLGRYFN